MTPLLLESLRAALEADGHHVMTADDGQSAIDAFEAADKAGAPFAVVITDFVMPIVDGRKVSTVVNQMRPGTPVIMLTGLRASRKRAGRHAALRGPHPGETHESRELRNTLDGCCSAS